MFEKKTSYFFNQLRIESFLKFTKTLCIIVVKSALGLLFLEYFCLKYTFFEMESISVFEIIKVGIGPSSSHTMGPWTAAELFLNLIKNTQSISNVKEVYVEFFGSLAKTGIGHGTDIAAVLGLSGEDFKTINTSKIDSKIALVKNSNQINLGGEKSIPFILENI